MASGSRKSGIRVSTFKSCGKRLAARLAGEESAPYIDREYVRPVFVSQFHVFRRLNAVYAQLRERLRSKGVENHLP